MSQLLAGKFDAEIRIGPLDLELRLGWDSFRLSTRLCIPETVHDRA